MLEIEHQFILRDVPDDIADRADRTRSIRQGYLTRVGHAIRVRAIDDQFVMTVKAGAGFVREEVEFDLAPDIAESLFRIAGDSVIEKTRYVLGRWEIDVFHGRHDGLLIGEVELDSVDEPMPPPPPGIVILRDVTHEPGFNNQFLASLVDSEARALIDLLMSDPEEALRSVRKRSPVDGE